MSDSPDLPDTHLVATQLSRALGAIERAHSPGCEPGTDRSICETCRVGYPCDAIAAIEALDEPAASFYRDGGWLR